MQVFTGAVLGFVYSRQYFRQYPKGRMVLVVQRAQDGNLFISNYEKYGFTRAGLNAKFFSRCVFRRILDKIDLYPTSLDCSQIVNTCDICQVFTGCECMLRSS